MLETVAWISIAVGFACASWIVVDELRSPQKMAVMNVVWPVTALYWSVFAVWFYFRMKRMAREHGQGSNNESPTPAQVATGTSHCGAGCMLADVGSEFAVAGLGLTLLGSPLWASYALDFVGAWALGIAFQYFAIKPMRSMTVAQALVAAVKADTLSILAFQVGMYGWMAFVFFKLFPGPHLTPFQPTYWLMMQIGMMCGFATSFPMNWFLIRSGLKEAM